MLLKMGALLYSPYAPRMAVKNAIGAEDKEKAEPSESEKSKRTVLSKVSRSANIVLSVYVFVLIGALIVSSVYFIDFTSTDSSSWVKGSVPVLIPPNETRVSKFMIYYFSDSTGDFDNDTFPMAVDPLFKTQTAWNGIYFYVSLNSEPLKQSMYARFTTTYPDGHNETYNIDGAIGTDVVSAQDYNATRGLYSVEIKNVASIDLNGTLNVNLMEQNFEKPYFYYGWTGLYISVAGLIIAVIYSALHVFEFSRSGFKQEEKRTRLEQIR